MNGLPNMLLLIKPGTDAALDEKVQQLVQEFEVFMNDDFSTAKVLANMFDIVSIINSIKDKHIADTAISSNTLSLLQTPIESLFRRRIWFGERAPGRWCPIRRGFATLNQH